MKPITFIGSSLDDLRAFSPDARHLAGYQLDRVQRGMEPVHWKPMTHIGFGVKEIRIQESSGIYRVIYVASFADRIYVLHAFQKKTQKTEQQHLEIARKRYREIANAHL
jgi:phage-related protein